jgi:hypothetical protein
MKLEAMYSGSKVVDEIYCETSSDGRLPVSTFDELQVVNSSDSNDWKFYYGYKILYKVGGEFLIIGMPEGVKDINQAVFAKGSKDPVSVKMELPTGKKSNTEIDIEWNEIDVHIAQKPNENARDEYLIYENKIYEILKPPVKVNEPIFFRLNECGCSFSKFYEKNKLSQDFFSLT